MKVEIIFFGGSPYIVPILHALYKSCVIKLVITTDREQSDAVPAFCKKYKLPYLSVSKITDETIRSIIDAEVPTGVLVSFGRIIPQSVIDVFPNGIVNIHPSLLPNYRGPSPVQSAILNGETETGVSIITLDDKVDHGPILAQEKINIDPTDTNLSLHDKLFTKAATILPEVLQKYTTKELIPQEQEHKKATFTKMLTRQDGFIDSAHPPEHLERIIRAYFPWPGVWTITRIKNQEVRIKLLPMQKLQVEGRKVMSFKDFCNGYKEGQEILEKLNLL